MFFCFNGGKLLLRGEIDGGKFVLQTSPSIEDADERDSVEQWQSLTLDLERKGYLDISRLFFLIFLTTYVLIIFLFSFFL